MVARIWLVLLCRGILRTLNGCYIEPYPYGYYPPRPSSMHTLEPMCIHSTPQLSPRELREIYARKSWRKVVAAAERRFPVRSTRPISRTRSPWIGIATT
jgi:hypothetical protein